MRISDWSSDVCSSDLPPYAQAGDRSLKEWVVIHKIKGLYDQGRGLSVRAISRELGISRNTVRKYLHLDEMQISATIADPSRTKVLDEHRDYLINQLGDRKSVV